MSNSVFNDLSKRAEAATKDLLKTVSAVTDENSFVEKDKFILSDTCLGEAVGEGVVSGFAHIFNIKVGIFATNPKVLKGSIGKANSKKIVRLIDSAVAASAPVIAILDTAGARFSEGIEAMEGYSEIFAALSEAYGEVPTVVAVKGADYGLSSYFCAVSDLCIAYKSAQIATSSPLILAGNTKLDPTKICTGEYLAANSDVITNVVSSDEELKKTVGAFLSLVEFSASDNTDDPNRTAKQANLKTPEGVISEVFDKGSVFNIRSGFAPEVKTGIARLDGISVGFVSVSGKITVEGAGKITELLNTCDSFGLPVINIVDCSGAQTSAETDGKTIRALSDMMFTYHHTQSPVISLITGKAIGVGYSAFAAKSNVNYSVAWADAQIGAVCGETAAALVYKDEIAKAADKEKAAEKLSKAYSEENLIAPVVAAKGYLDNVIDSSLSRPYLVAALITFVD